MESVRNVSRVSAVLVREDTRGQNGVVKGSSKDARSSSEEGGGRIQTGAYRDTTSPFLSSSLLDHGPRLAHVERGLVKIDCGFVSALSRPVSTNPRRSYHEREILLPYRAKMSRVVPG